VGEEGNLVVGHEVAGVAIVAIAIGRYKLVRGLPAVLTIVAKLADILAPMVVTVAMAKMELTGKMVALVI
jgi:hypothetical protein